MDELLNEYLIQEDNIKNNGYVPTSMNDTTPNKSRINTQQDNNRQHEYDEYMSRTKELYYTMSLCDLFRAIWFSASSCYICLTEYTKYIIGWKSRNNAIMDVSKRLAAKNMMYVKIFQAFATNRNIVSPELNQFFSEYTDNVKYTDEEYDINELKEIEMRSKECEPYCSLSIANDYKPIKSGLMSLIFKGVIHNDGEAGTEVVVKYLRKNISKNFNSSMKNLVVFAKLTRYVPHLRTLNIESLILQNIICLNDQVCFRKELANITLYYQNWKEYKYIKIPKPYADYTEKINPDIIVMEYINGMKITEIDPADNGSFGKILAGFNAKAAFCTSFYHGDLHPGNILFIKNTPETPEKPVHQIGIIDFGIIGHLSSNDQELLFLSVKFMYQRRLNKIIDMIMSCQLSESANLELDIKDIIPDKKSEKFTTLHQTLTEVLMRYTTPHIKFFGVAEIYEINYILNNYGLMFKRSLYRLFITIAIMDSIGTQLGGELSYIQHMTDIIVEMFNIDIHERDEDDDA
jgi:ubiquinone biosynthesis protein